jgi:Ser/Thr protein kinase RdoA (MazF antagonist)
MAEGGAGRGQSGGRLRANLKAEYGIAAGSMSELDQDVWRVERPDGPDWVARWFPSRRPAAAAEGDAAVLRYLEAREFPAERCAADQPVSELDGRAVLVTEWADPVPRGQRRDAIREAGGLARLGALLGQLHTMDGPAAARTGGAWHHLADGRPSAEIEAAGRMLDAAAPAIPGRERAAFDALRSEVAALDAAEGLPEGLTHPDFVLANVVATPDGMVLVDWAGAGRGPRLWSLAFFLYAEAMKEPRRAGVVLRGYREHVTLDPAELDRLGDVARARPLILRAWSVCVGRTSPSDALAAAARTAEFTDALGNRIREVVAGTEGSRGAGTGSTGRSAIS